MTAAALEEFGFWWCGKGYEKQAYPYCKVNHNLIGHYRCPTQLPVATNMSGMYSRPVYPGKEATTPGTGMYSE
jgi:hypothetical protein